MSLWVIYIGVAVLFFTFSNILDKVILSRWIRDPRLNTFGNASFGLCIAVMLLLAGWVTVGPTWVVALNVVAGAMYIGGNWAYFRAVQVEEISRVVALAYLSPILVGVLSIPLFGEQLSASIYLGVVLLVVGAILVASHSLQAIRLSQGFWWMLLAMFFFAFNILLLHVALEHQDLWTVFAQTRFGGAIAALTLLPFALREARRVVGQGGVKPLGAILLSEGSTLIGLLLFTAALGLESATRVNALSSIQPFFMLAATVLLSLFWPTILKEEMTPVVIVQKVVGITALVVGGLLII